MTVTAVANGPTDTRAGALPASWIGILALLTAVSPLATDMYLPGLPQMAADLGVSPSAVQLTLTAFMAGLGLGQLVIGPLSDRFGRRPLLVAGTVVCVLASVACALAPTIAVLVAARFVQGFGGAAGVVLSRAVISDRARGAAAAKIFSVMMMINGVAPAAAPLVGGALLGVIGWRGVFWVLTGLAVIMLIGVLGWIVETHPAERRTTGGLRALARDGAGLLRDRRFVGYTLAFSLGFTVMFAYISASPFVLQRMLGLSQMQYSMAFAANAAGLVAVSALNARVVERLGAQRLLTLAIMALIPLSVGLLIDALVGLTRWPTLILLWCAVAVMGLVLSNAAALAIEQSHHAAGTGSAILGAAQFGFAGIVSPLVGIAGEESAMPMGLAMLTCAVLAGAALLLSLDRRRRPAVPTR